MAHQHRWLRIATTILLLFITLLSCALPGTVGIQPTQPYTEEYTGSSTNDNYVERDIIEHITSTPQPTLTLTPTNEIVIIESSSTPEQDIILLSNFFPYTIQEGDSFALLARRFCGDERKYKWLLRVNGMEEGEILEIGREVIIDCGGNP